MSNKGKVSASSGGSALATAISDIEMAKAGESRMAKESRQQMYQAPSVRVPGAVIIVSNATRMMTGLSWDFSQTIDRQRQAFGLAKEFTTRLTWDRQVFDIGLSRFA